MPFSLAFAISDYAIISFSIAFINFLYFALSSFSAAMPPPLTPFADAAATPAFFFAAIFISFSLRFRFIAAASDYCFSMRCFSPPFRLSIFFVDAFIYFSPPDPAIISIFFFATYFHFAMTRDFRRHAIRFHFRRLCHAIFIILPFSLRFHYFDCCHAFIITRLFFRFFIIFAAADLLLLPIFRH